MEQSTTNKLPLKVLYVEDDSDIRDNTYEILSRRIESVMSASNGLECLDIYRQFKPDVVITDIKMPRLDGLAMVRKIRGKNPQQHIIIVSAYNETEFLAQAIELGVDSFVLKPLHWPRLYDTLKQIAQSIWFEDELAQKNNLIAQKQALLESMINSANQIGFISADTSLQVTLNNIIINQWLTKQNLAPVSTLQPLFPLWKGMSDNHPLIEMVQKTLDGQTVTPIEDILWDKTGTKLYELNCWPITCAEQSNISGVSIMLVDISEKKKNREEINRYKLHLEDLVKQRTDELLASEFRYKNLIERLNDGLMITHTNTIALANSALGKLMNMNPADLVGQSLLSLFSNHIADHINNIHQKRLNGEDVPDIYETQITTADQKLIPVELNVSRINQDDSLNHVVIIRDLSHRHSIEKERNKLASAVGQIGEGVMITSNTGIIEYVNASFCKITQYTEEEVIGKKTSLLKSGKHNDTFYQHMWSTLQNGSNWTGVLVNKKKDGSLYHEHSVISPITDSLGNIVHFVAVKRDITNDLQMEKKMRQSQKLQAIGTLAGGIAHDFNNLLMGMSVYTELAINELNTDSTIREYLMQVRSEQLRARALVEKILLFSRQQEDEVLHEIKIKEAASGFIDMLRVTLPPSINMEVHLEETGRMALDPTHLQQILINLCTNASHAMSGRGNLTIEIKRAKKQLHNNGDHDVLLISVRDTGTGIDPKIQERIFEPFFTTKPVGEGTGLGLATIHGIVEKYNGTIDLQSEPGKGTTFNIFLPINHQNK
ncbi:MAG: PAS domain S-box protein [Bacteroidales bacterium]|nr:PAS domain S-box protein [Bacteroidales bacterium]MDD3665474.1 PAS domain S-box protein [Bacteroidales bacterium]